MRQILISLILVLLFFRIVEAQANNTSKLTWDQDAPDLATANGYVYKYYPDISVVGITLNSVSCVIAIPGPFVCSVNYPAFTPGNHTLTITAANIVGESIKSTSFSFAFVVIPSPPKNIRISGD
jgi:hypothetical protein